MLALDMTMLAKKHLVPGQVCSIKWTTSNDTEKSIQYTVATTDIVLTYRFRAEGGEWVPVRDRINLDRTAQPYGGERLWFECPGCDRRCRILYGGTRFRCRTCHRLTYPVQYDKCSAPGVSRARAIRRKLGGSMSLDAAFPPKPKGMHWRTYERLWEADEEAAASNDEKFVAMIVARRRFR